MARKRLVDMENDIKKAIEKDPTNPDIFNMIKDMVTTYFARSKLLSNYNDIEEVSLLLSEDLYMKVVNGKPVYSWLGYIAKSKIGYIRRYREMTQSEIIDVSNDDELKETIVNMSTSGSLSYKRFDDLVDKVSVSQIVMKGIDDVLDEYSRYRRYSSIWNNIYLSVILSLSCGRKVHIMLDESESMYSDLMINRIKDGIRKNVFELKNTYDLNYAPMELFYLEESSVDGNPDQ